MSGSLFIETQCTMDQELAGDASYVPGRRLACTHQMAALFSAK